MFLLPLAIAIALGFACVRLLWPGGLRPCRHDWLKLWLGIGIGLGVHSAIYFLARRGGVLIAIELALIALLAFGAKGCAQCAEPPVPVQPRAKYSALLTLLFWSIAACSLATFVLFSLGGPHGEWDAWTIWNMHARAMFRDASHFRDLFTTVMARSNPDYPLLIPASIAATWSYIGEDSVVVPSAIALLFTLATAGVLVSAVSWLRSPMQGHLAGILLLGAASFVRFGSSQYADVPFSFYVVATLAMLAFSHRDPEASKYPVLAGILASMAAWTKNEGLLFVILVLLASVLISRRQAVWVLAGALPVLAVDLYFKLALAPPSYLVVGNNAASVAARSYDFGRYAAILKSLATETAGFGGFLFGSIVTLAIYLACMGIERRPEVRTCLRILSGMAAGYFAIYLLFSPNLDWQLTTSLKRLLAQLWPAAVLAAMLLTGVPEKLFTAVPAPEKSKSKRNPAKARRV